ncbi:hypothetical protein PV327_005890 [Microctonus hyperodae]|uniref:Uncharacterized protein n=1 Tax=Microctonus hyperodae TaxID=165561 RepID=A0AA39G2A9_MICHY|nr:hypothetical protein PV327_005890 [Microctonus hyperodae]
MSLLDVAKQAMRIFSTALCVLPRMDMPGCTILHCEYNAFMYNKRRSLFNIAMSLPLSLMYSKCTGIKRVYAHEQQAPKLMG